MCNCVVLFTHRNGLLLNFLIQTRNCSIIFLVEQSKLQFCNAVFVFSCLTLENRIKYQPKLLWNKIYAITKYVFACHSAKWCWKHNIDKVQFKSQYSNLVYWQGNISSICYESGVVFNSFVQLTKIISKHVLKLHQIPVPIL